MKKKITQKQLATALVAIFNEKFSEYQEHYKACPHGWGCGKRFPAWQAEGNSLLETLNKVRDIIHLTPYTLVMSKKGVYYITPKTYRVVITSTSQNEVTVAAPDETTARAKAEQMLDYMGLKEINLDFNVERNWKEAV